MSAWVRRCAICGLVTFCLMLLVGCGGSSSIAITPSAVLLAPGQSFQFGTIRTGNSATSGQPLPTFTVNGVAGGSSSTGTITAEGIYTAPSTLPAQPVTVGIVGQSSAAAVTFFNPASFTPGSVAATQNPLVASYSIVAPAATGVQVQFGLDTSYGLTTSAVQNPNGGPVTILVAGMLANTTYHMQATFKLSNGTDVADSDQTFTTGSIPAARIPNITAQGAASGGVELFSLIPYVAGDLLSAVATDTNGNVIWYYDTGSADEAFPIKPLPNGHFMLNVYPAVGSSGAPNEIREVDLAGNIINRIPLATVDQALAGIGSFQLAQFHHDFAVLPNGHLILLGNYDQTINNVAGIPPGTVMLGDALVDWDPQGGVAWTWSTFDHLDLTHAPYGLADWTHANAIIYSPDDGNLILSMRNQNWIIKINYQNGAGDGSILWRFGPGGDFTLAGQEAPIDWNYGQHYPTIISPNNSGVFSLMFFDNGNNRLMDSNNDVCGTPGVGACYSDAPIFQIDETAKSATALWLDDLLPAYSICCGDSLMLPNGNTEFDIAADVNTPAVSKIEEVSESQNLLWEIYVTDQLAYRGFRIPSLYPGQTWTAATAATPSLTKSVIRPSELSPEALKKALERLP